MGNKTLVVNLKDGVGWLLERNTKITEGVSRCIDEESTAKVIRGHRVWYWFLRRIGEPNLDDWTTNRRLQTLESMQPTHAGLNAFLAHADVRLGDIVELCDKPGRSTRR